MCQKFGKQRGCIGEGEVAAEGDFDNDSPSNLPSAVVCNLFINLFLIFASICCKISTRRYI
jgi:hypothetical protein